MFFLLEILERIALWSLVHFFKRRPPGIYDLNFTQILESQALKKYNLWPGKPNKNWRERPQQSMTCTLQGFFLESKALRKKNDLMNGEKLKARPPTIYDLHIPGFLLGSKALRKKPWPHEWKKSEGKAPSNLWPAHFIYFGVQGLKNKTLTSRMEKTFEDKAPSNLWSAHSRFFLGGPRP